MRSHLYWREKGLGDQIFWEKTKSVKNVRKSVKNANMLQCWNILVKTKMWMTTWCFTTYLHQSLKIWRQKQQRTTFGLREQQGIHVLLIIIWNKSKTVLTAPFDLGLLGSFFVSLPLQSQSVPFPECHFTEFLSFCYYFDFCVTHFFFPSLDFSYHFRYFFVYKMIYVFFYPLLFENTLIEILTGSLSNCDTWYTKLWQI